MTASPEAIEHARIAARAADDNKAEDITVLDVSNNLVITDAFVIATGDNERHVNSIVEDIEEKLTDSGVKPIRREGAREGHWALLDYGTIIVHVQGREERDFYALDRLWKDSPVIDVPGIEQLERPASWDGDAVTVSSIDEIPLAGTEPGSESF